MISLKQRGRAGLQFLGSLQYYASSELRGRAAKEFDAQPEAAGLEKEWTRDADSSVWQDRIHRARDVAERSSAYRFERFYQRYVAEQNYIRAIPAVEARRPEYERWEAERRPRDKCRLKLDPALNAPDWWKGVEWHLEPGGWDGYDLQGPMFMAGIGPYVFSRGGYAAVDAGENILEHRAMVIRHARVKDPKRVYEVGCGGSSTLGVARRLFPNAELVGGDLSPTLLRRGHFMSEMLGLDITFRQEDGRKVAEKDGSVDLVLSYAVHHEMPQPVTRDTLKEMFRILAPGGDMVISDPPPFGAVKPLQAVVLDWDTDNRSEPYFSEAAMLNLATEMKKVGFVDVEEFALGPNGYPWVTRGRKPS